LITAALLALLTLSTVLSVIPMTKGATTYTEITGTLNGASYLIRIPDPIENWNRNIVIYCHGYSHTEPQPPLATLGTDGIFLAGGTAFAMSSYGMGGYFISTAVNNTYLLTQYVKTAYNVTGKIFLFGISQGGGVALQLAEKYPNLYSGVLDISGSKDLKISYATRVDQLSAKNDTELTAKLQALGASVPPFPFTSLAQLQSFNIQQRDDMGNATGGTPDTVPKAYEDISATYHANISVPVVTVHSLGDPVNTYAQALAYQAAVAAAGKSSFYRLYPTNGTGHVDSTVTSQISARLAELLAWSNALTGSAWSMFRNDLQHTGYSASPAPSTNQTLWTYTVGGYIASSPAIANGKVYVGSYDYKFYCLDAATGAHIWNFTTGGIVGSSPTVADSRVYVGSDDDNIYCLDAASGALLWNYTTGGDVVSCPAVSGGLVYVGSKSDLLYCLNASNGAYMWSYMTSGDVLSSPAIADGRVYVGSYDNKVYCLNALTGAHIWNYTTGGWVWSSPAVADGKVYVGSNDTKVYALNALTGALVWNYATGAEVISSPAVADGKVYVGSFDNKVYCLNALTGAHIWNYTTGNDVFASPAVADGKVYISSIGHVVYCLNAADGASIWSYTTGSDVYSSPAVANGVVYVGSVDRKVYAFSASPPISASGWSKTYGGTASDVGWGEIVQTSDGGYAMAGSTSSYGAGDSDGWLIKTDAAGNVQWNKTYGGTGGDAPLGMIQTTDGGYAMIGGTASFGTVGNDIWLVKTDSAGNMQWNKTYGGTGAERAWSAVQTIDGGYAIGGWTTSFGAGGADLWLIKTDSTGNMQWNKTFGGNGTDYGLSIVQTNDGGYAVAGSTTTFGVGSADVWLVKFSSSGVMEWNRTYGGTGYDEAYALRIASDGGYAMGCWTNSFGAGGNDFWLVKTDSAGNMQWNKTYGGTGAENANCMVLTSEGGYAMTGSTTSFGAGNSDFWLVKVDAAGNLQWNMTYGGTGAETGYSVVQTSDGGYAVLGSTNSFGAGGSDFWLVKVDAYGVVPEGLAIGVIMLLSSVAAAIGTFCFRKPRRIIN
jgi:outer membrane protein assembly factor BamB/pimeloyl-ACP methyl ester carboxylesterase